MDTVALNVVEFKVLERIKRKFDFFTFYRHNFKQE